jgi:hypothetical protein
LFVSFLSSFRSKAPLLSSFLLVVMVTTRAMHVPMRQLLVGGGARLNNFHVKVQIFVGQRMIQIDNHFVL